MSLLTDTLARYSIKKLLGLTHRGATKDPGNEGEAVRFFLPANAIETYTISTTAGAVAATILDCTNAVLGGLTSRLNLTLDGGSQGKSYSVTVAATHDLVVSGYINPLTNLPYVAGDRVSNILTTKWGTSWRPVLYDNNTTEIPPLASQDWFLEETGVITSEDNLSLTSATLSCYVYVGNTVADLVSDTAYGAGWNGDTTHAASKNAIYDKIEAMGGGGYTNLTQFVDQTAWRVFYSNTSGDVTELALGDAGKVLTSGGAAAAPTWETPVTPTVDGSGTTNEITYWVDSNTLGALAVATYPSLTELSYVKGLSSAIQTQLNAKQASDADLTAIAALGFTATAFLKKTAADTWALDTNTYLTTVDISADTNLSATSGIVLTGDQLTHSTANGYVHVPSDGASTQVLQYSSAGTAKWVTLSGDASIADGGAVTVANDSHTHTGSTLTITSATAGNWKVLYSNGTGVVTELALGAASTVLTGGGAAAAPTFSLVKGASLDYDAILMVQVFS